MSHCRVDTDILIAGDACCVYTWSRVFIPLELAFPELAAWRRQRHVGQIYLLRGCESPRAMRALLCRLWQAVVVSRVDDVVIAADPTETHRFTPFGFEDALLGMRPWPLADGAAVTCMVLHMEIHRRQLEARVLDWIRESAHEAVADADSSG